MKTIRSSILRNYYEATYDGREQDQFAGATFDELVALCRITSPDMTEWAVADSADTFGRPDLAKHAAKLPPDSMPDTRSDIQKVSAEHPCVAILRERSADLRVKLEGTRARALECQSVALTGWTGLASLRPWLHIELRVCTTKDSNALSPRQAVHRIRLVECDSACTHAALDSTSAKIIEVVKADADAFDLALLRSHRKLERLMVVAPRVVGVSHLTGLKLTRLHLQGLSWSTDLSDVVTDSGPTLEELTLVTNEPVPPSALPLPKGLQALTVAAHPEVRQEWIDFAVKHPKLRVDFVPRPAPPRRKPAPKLASLRKKKRFESWEGEVAPSAIKSSRALVGDAASALDALGPSATKASQRAVLQKAVKAFNRLDAREPFITTIEAEDIVRELRELQSRTKLSDQLELIDELRDF